MASFGVRLATLLACAAVCSSLRRLQRATPVPDAVREGRLRRLEAEFAKVSSWSQEDARKAYRNLYPPGHNLPSSHAVRVIVDEEQRVYFRPEPYHLWADPNQHQTGFGALNTPKMSGPRLKGIPLVMNNWPRVLLEISKEFLATSLVFLTRAIEKSRRAGEPPLPPVDATFALWDWCGTYYVDYDTSALGSHKMPPLLSWNVREGCNAVATPYYDWEYRHQNFTPGSSWRPDSYPITPWNKRKAVMMWRGSIASWDGARVRAVRIGRRHPEMLDIKISIAGTDGWVHQHPPGEPEKSPLCWGFMQGVAAAGSYGGLANASECDGVGGTFMSIEQQMEYKYILDVDGGASSFRLKRDFISGAAVFRVMHESKADDNEQFFYPELEPWKHFIPVSYDNLEADLPAKVKWAREHDSKVQEIAETAAAFVHKHLREEDAMWQLTTTLRQVARKQDGWKPKPSSENHMRRFCCSDLLEASTVLPTERLKLGRPPNSGWTDADLKMWPSLYGQCVEMFPEECGVNGTRLDGSDSTAPAAGAVLGNAAALGSAAGSALGAAPKVHASTRLSNLFAIPLEWKPL